MERKPEPFDDADALAARIAQKIGGKIVLALPLGLGKANTIANAIYSRAAANPTQPLSIFTALTLERPRLSGLEKQFIGPVLDRLFGSYPPLLYAEALRNGTLPTHIDVSEFFFLAGRWLGVSQAQQNYIAANYTHAAGYVLDRNVNVIAQLVATRVVNGETRYSLSCNTDLTLDLLRARDEGRADFLVAAEVNSELPFMPGGGDLPASAFDFIYENEKTDFALFAPPKQPIPLTSYAIGLNVATLVKDGGTLQLGIGAEGDAAAYALILRQKTNDAFREIATALAPQSGALPRELSIFESGLFAASEMFVDSFLDLIEAGVVKREVDGALLHGGFFLGPRNFYRRLREMPETLRAKLQMKPISYVNELYGEEDAKRRARVNARFVNNGMMATLLGAVVSDGLEDGNVVSGVGGQYNFVAQAFALQGARSIITINATRTSGGKTLSNIRWSYGHQTIPRHLRDIIVTEYGIADLRGKSDEQIIAGMLSVTDSRFQDELLREAKAAKKIAKNYEIPAAYRDNTPARIARTLTPARESGLLPDFPLGTDFTETELLLIPALQRLKQGTGSPLALARLALRGLSMGNSDQISACLARMNLEKPANFRDRLYRALLKGALA